ncbi:MAG: hypothetical protein PV340_02130 [Wolbachia sp.]|nr:hypothetical protein [Wolbachia sp.]MDD9335947.1 hypothetical protein [Wolbachia sp.]
MSKLLDNFNQYTKYGTVSTQGNENSILRSFYQSVSHVDIIVGPIIDTMFGIQPHFSHIDGRRYENPG